MSTCHTLCQPQELQFANRGQTLERELLAAENPEGISVNTPLNRRFMQQHPEIGTNATNQLEPAGPSNARTNRRPRRGRSTRSSILAGIDYERINHMISESVSQMLNYVHLSHNSNVPPANTAADRPESRSTFSSRSSYVSSRRGTRNISSFSTEKVTTIIQNWHIKFDGSNQGLCTRRFSVRIYQFSASDWY